MFSSFWKMYYCSFRRAYNEFGHKKYRFNRHKHALSAKNVYASLQCFFKKVFALAMNFWSILSVFAQAQSTKIENLINDTKKNYE